ncbi:Uncharacterized protein BWINRASL_00749 [Bacillus mycoides]|nr:hypothetical protein IEQ_00615 [Bacillus cereus BAG6X1-2]SCM92413.1 Uncharacterized protein BWINRASL_00749 [Bacillus mycoides]
MEECIDDLLRRMGDETESWHRAYDEAKELNDLLTFPYLQTFDKVYKKRGNLFIPH